MQGSLEVRGSTVEGTVPEVGDGGIGVFLLQEEAKTGHGSLGDRGADGVGSGRTSSEGALSFFVQGLGVRSPRRLGEFSPSSVVVLLVSDRYSY